MPHLGTQPVSGRSHLSRPIWDDAVDNLEIQEGGDPAPAPMATYAGGECPGGVTSTSLLHSVGKTGGPPR